MPLCEATLSLTLPRYPAVASIGCPHTWTACFQELSAPGSRFLTERSTSAFYVAVYDSDSAIMTDGCVHEFTVDVPMKAEILATTKSNNYMLNVLTKMASEDKGGSFGVLVDPAGNVAESCVMGLAEELVGNLLSAISQEVVPAGDAHQCGDVFCCWRRSHCASAQLGWAD